MILNECLVKSYPHFKDLMPSTKIFATKIRLILKVVRLNSIRKKVKITIKDLYINGFKKSVGKLIGGVVISSLRKPVRKRVADKFRDTKN